VNFFNLYLKLARRTFYQTGFDGLRKKTQVVYRRVDVAWAPRGNIHQRPLFLIILVKKYLAYMKDFHALAINFNHDGSAAILSNGRVKAFVNTERFSKKKKHPGIRSNDLTELLRQAGIGLQDIGYVLCATFM
jgi:hypothetical protein